MRSMRAGLDEAILGSMASGDSGNPEEARGLSFHDKWSLILGMAHAAQSWAKGEKGQPASRAQ